MSQHSACHKLAESLCEVTAMTAGVLQAVCNKRTLKGPGLRTSWLTCPSTVARPERRTRTLWSCVSAPAHACTHPHRRQCFNFCTDSSCLPVRQAPHELCGLAITAPRMA